MNMKTTALLLAVAMVLAGTAVFAVGAEGDGAADDATVDKSTVYVKVGGTATVDFNITEPDENYYSNTVEWTSEGSAISTDPESPTGITQIETEVASIAITGTDGDYSASIIGMEAGTVMDYTLTYKITTTVKDSGSQGVSQTLTYQMDIVVITSPLGEKLFYDGESDVALQYGEPIDGFVIPGYDDDYVYYAIGLPNGIQMTPDGRISGTPVPGAEQQDGKYDVTVVATHIASNQTFSETYSDIDVSPADSDTFEYEVTGDAKVVAEGEKYIIVQGDSLTLTTSISSTPTNVTSVYIINDDSGSVTQTTIDGTSGVYNVPTSGSGQFTVVMVNGDVMESFGLVVVAISADVQTGIGFSPEDGYTVDPDATGTE